MTSNTAGGPPHTHDPDDPMTRSGARWCPDHGKWECVAKLGRPHHGDAIRGQAYCKNHVGMTRELAKIQGEANLQVWRTQIGADRQPIDLGATVIDQLRVAIMRADLYGELLRMQYEDEGYGGLVGVTQVAGRDGGSVVSGESVRALQKLEGEWRDRAVRFAKTAHDMGIDERNIEIEQSKAQRVVSAFLAVLEHLMGFVPEADRLSARDAAVSRFLEGIGRGDLPPDVVVGEVG